MNSDDKRSGWLVIALPFVPVSVFLLAAYGTWLSGEGSGGMSGWVEAVGTTVGVVAAVVAARFAWQAYRLELGRDRDRQAEAERAQASQIAAWMESRTGVAQRGLVGQPMMDSVLASRWGIFIQNASTLPVYDVVARVAVVTATVDNEADRDNLGRFEIGLVAPRSEPKFVGLSQQHDDARGQRQEALLDGSLVSVQYEVALEFRDASNRTWARGFDGRLLP